MSVTDWEKDDAVVTARANFMACAYNAFVNFDVPRGRRKMLHLGEAINHCERVEGRAKLQRLVDLGVIDGFTPCPPECEVRPGGLFHVAGCENDMNHDVSRARRQRAQETLPGGPGGHGGLYAAIVSLVGESGESDPPLW